MASRIPKKRRPFLHKFLLWAGGLAIIMTAAYISIITGCKLKTVIIEDCTRYTDEELTSKLVTKDTDQITFLMYLRYKFKEQPKIPFIESLDVSMEDLNTIKVTVYEKTVVGCVEMMDSYMYFDKDGIVVESSKDRIENVPLVTGLKFDKIVLYEKLTIQKEALFETILNLTHLIQKFAIDVDKLYINSSNEVVLYCGGNEVLLGKRDFYDDQIAALQSVLKSAENQKLSYDLRYYDANNTKIIAKPLN